MCLRGKERMRDHLKGRKECAFFFTGNVMWEGFVLNLLKGDREH